MELNNTSYLLLGMVALGPMSGYDIKQRADGSTRHFWQISYGQIYPELKALEKAGMVQAAEAARGSRQRTLHQLTDTGTEALTEWISDSTVTPVELRDEMLLKLFFSDSVATEDRIALARNMARRHRESASGLAAQEPPHLDKPCPMRLEVLQFGIGLHTWCADFYTQLADRLEEGDAPASPGKGRGTNDV
jgi:PadR family transcriptional regulator, regulatory protein AphA